MPKTIQSYLFTTIIFLGSFVLIWTILHFGSIEAECYPPRLSYPATSLYALITLFMPLLGGLGLSRLFAKSYNKRNKIETPWIPRNKSLFYLLLALYLLTAIVGVSMAERQNLQMAISEYNRITGDQMPCHDSIYRCHLRMPILPLVTIGYSSYSIAYIDCWGGWEVHVWYFVGAKRLFSFPVWYS